MKAYIFAAVAALAFAGPAFATNHQPSKLMAASPMNCAVPCYNDITKDVPNGRASASLFPDVPREDVSAFTNDVGTENPFEVYRPRPLREGLSD